ITPERSAVIIVGDVTLAEARAMAEAAFGQWSKGSGQPIALRAVKPPATPALVGVNLPRMPQTFVTLGVRGVPAGHPDEHALDMVSDLFGGQFNSRLNMRLREELGVSYGAQSTHDQNKAGGVFLA